MVNVKKINGTRVHNYGISIWDFFKEFEQSGLNYLQVKVSPPPGIKTTYSFVSPGKDVHQSTFSPFAITDVNDYLRNNVKVQLDGVIEIDQNGEIYELFNPDDKKPVFDSQAGACWLEEVLKNKKNRLKVYHSSENELRTYDAVQEQHHRVIGLNTADFDSYNLADFLKRQLVCVREKR